MADEQQNVGDSYGNFSLKARDMEEKQSIMKDRLVLIGKNFIDYREDTSRKILEIKKDVEKMKQDLERIKMFIESLSNEFSKFAKKDDVEILSKQLKMFRAFEQ